MELRQGDRPHPAGPAEIVLMASAARRYYVDNRSKTDIADELGVSRFKVARLLEAARSSGLVRIEIGWTGDIDVDLSASLQEAYGLAHAIVISTPDSDPKQLRSALGTAAAALLEEIVTADDVLGLAWARSISVMTASLRRLAPAPVVQLTGALVGADTDDSSIELVRDVAALSGGTAYLFFAPHVVADASTAAALRRQPDVARAFSKFGEVTKAVAGVGLWSPGHSTVHDALDDRERQRLRKAGVVAEVSGIMLDTDGNLVKASLRERMIGIEAEQLSAIPEVVGIAYNAVKAPAVRAALRGRLVNALVTHDSMATALLKDR